METITLILLLLLGFKRSYKLLWVLVIILIGIFAEDGFLWIMVFAAICIIVIAGAILLLPQGNGQSNTKNKSLHGKDQL